MIPALAHRPSECRWCGVPRTGPRPHDCRCQGYGPKTTTCGASRRMRAHTELLDRPFNQSGGAGAIRTWDTSCSPRAEQRPRLPHRERPHRCRSGWALVMSVWANETKDWTATKNVMGYWIVHRFARTWNGQISVYLTIRSAFPSFSPACGPEGVSCQIAPGNVQANKYRLTKCVVPASPTLHLQSWISFSALVMQFREYRNVPSRRSIFQRAHVNTRTYVYISPVMHAPSPTQRHNSMFPSRLLQGSGLSRDQDLFYHNLSRSDWTAINMLRHHRYN